MSRLEKQPMAVALIACATLAALTMTAQAQTLRLSVNPYSGAVTIQNTSTTDAAALDGYQITSLAGKLVPDPTNTLGIGWDSLTDAAITGWAEYAPTANALSELNLLSSTSIAASGSLSLGHAFVPLGTRDLAWGYSVHAAGGPQVVTNPGPVQYVGGMQLQIIKLLGPGNVVEATPAMLYNPEPVSLNVDGYTISSPSSSLNPGGFNGFAGRGVAGWSSYAPSAGALSELNLTSSKVFAPGKAQVLGSPFAAGGTPDLVLEFHLVGGGAAAPVGSVVYLDQLAGDVNNDHVVNIFDINLISSNWNTAGPAGDGNYDGTVNIFDINYVSSHWGNTLPGNATAVPEPSSMALLAMGLIVGGAAVSRRRRIA
jgi:hypothetical protein